MKRITGLTLILFFLFAGSVFAASVSRISKEELKADIESQNVTVLDVRSGRDWSTSGLKIPGAIRASGSDFDSWSKSYDKDKKIVLYCA
jgi:rhodanese-related sulfurtransferase